MHTVPGGGIKGGSNTLLSFHSRSHGTYIDGISEIGAHLYFKLQFELFHAFVQIDCSLKFDFIL